MGLRIVLANFRCLCLVLAGSCNLVRRIVGEFCHRVGTMRSLFHDLLIGNNFLHFFDNGRQEKPDGTPARQVPAVIPAHCLGERRYEASFSATLPGVFLFGSFSKNRARR